MSTMGRILTLLSGFIVLAAITQAAEDRNLVVGENTPVWIAHCPNPEGPISYTRIENGIVRDAHDDWKSGKHTLDSVRSKRSIDENANFKNPMKLNYGDDLEESNPDDKISKSKRWVPMSRKILETSFLVVMDYNITWPSDENVLKKLIKERILYALAFWNGLNLQLRYANEPKIRLRIAGIVIGRNKEAMPYLRLAETERGLNEIAAITLMNEYWASMSQNNTDFPYDSYHIVATMTDAEAEERSEMLPPFYNSIFSGGPRSTGFLFANDHLFSALPKGGSDIMEKIGTLLQFYARQIVPDVKQHRHLSSGKLINATILPGQFVPPVKQCVARGWDTDATVCTPFVLPDPTCSQLLCKNSSESSRCRNSGTPLVGSPCGHDGKNICLNEECVEKSQL